MLVRSTRKYKKCCGAPARSGTPGRDTMGGTALEQRVVRAAEAALAERRYVTAIDVFVGVGWLTRSRVDDWRKGRVNCLERVVEANLSKLSTAMKVFSRWAQRRGLQPSETVYVARTRGHRRPLRFSVSGKHDIERAYRTHWVAPELCAAKREQRAEPAEPSMPSRSRVSTTVPSGGRDCQTSP
jgi:hypothetical protein